MENIFENVHDNGQLDSEYKHAVEQAKIAAKQYKEKVVIVQSDVFHDHEYKFNWIVESMRYTIYPDSHKEYWKIVKTINPGE